MRIVILQEIDFVTKHRIELPTSSYADLQANPAAVPATLEELTTSLAECSFTQAHACQPCLGSLTSLPRAFASASTLTMILGKNAPSQTLRLQPSPLVDAQVSLRRVCAAWPRFLRRDFPTP